MEIRYSKQAKAEIEHWKKSGNKIIQEKISTLIEDVELHPFSGLGKPEQLKYNLAGLWSRRINQEHRLVYEVKDGYIEIHSLVGHY